MTDSILKVENLTARLDGVVLEPLRVVLGHAPSDAKVHPCWERSGDIGAVLDELGANGVLQALVEGGPKTASAFIAAGVVNRIVWYAAPALAGSTGTVGAFVDLTTSTIGDLRRGRLVDVRVVGEDVRIELEV